MPKSTTAALVSCTLVAGFLLGTMWERDARRPPATEMTAPTPSPASASEGPRRVRPILDWFLEAQEQDGDVRVWLREPERFVRES